MKPEDHDIVLAELDDAANADTTKKLKRSFLEQLLSPQSLQWMMACGSGLLMLGFVVWLWTVGIFENPLVIAAASGAATLGVLAAGMSMIRMTRYQLAGKWLTLLGALALPLNLWLYDAQGLITLADGGHLWIPAAGCCFLYAGIARVLRDATFVYTLVGGVVMTGMLFLADQTVGRFWTLMPPATFLLSVGWISAFAERFFVDNDGDFSRKKFGLAFQRAGVLTVTSGLALLFGGYLAAIVGPVFADLIPMVSINQTEKFWALGLILTSAVGFGIQGATHKYQNYFLASLCLFVAAIPVTLNIFAVPITVCSVSIFAAIITIALNLFVAVTNLKSDQTKEGSTAFSKILYGSQTIVSVLAILPLLHMAAETLLPELSFVAALNWWTALQYLLTALASWVVGWNLTVDAEKTGKSNIDGAICFVAGGIVLVISVWTAGWIQTFMAPNIFAIVALSVPAAVAICGRVFVTERSQKTSRMVTSLMMSTHLGLLGASHVTGLLAFPGTHPVWTASLAVATVAYWLASQGNAVGLNRILCYLSATAAVALAGNWFGLDFGYCLILSPMLLGTAIKITDSIWLEGEKEGNEVLSTPLATAGNFLVLGSGAASVLLAMSRWLEGSTGGPLMLVMLAMLGCTTLVSFLTKNDYWRTAFRALIVAIVGSSICIFDGFLKLDGWHRGEICSLLGGIALTILGHVAWAREKDGVEDDMATASLVTGALMFTLPMAIGLLFYRLGDSPENHWRLFHEIGAIVGSLVLLGSGLLCRLRSTTIAGGSLLVFFVGSLVTLVRLPNQLQSVSVMMMVGGGLFFATALLMSIYRDRLVSLPRRVREGEGVYRVLRWR